MKKIIWRTTLTLPVLALFSSAAAAQTQYTITELAPGSCVPSSINDYGYVTGTCDATATLWQNAAAITLGRLPGGTYSISASANSSGAAVGNSDTGNSRPKATLFRNGAAIDIDPSAANAYAIFINESGVIAGNALKGFGTCNSWSAAIYVEDSSKPGQFRRTDLQPYPGGDGKARCEWAAAANQTLQVVGWVQNTLFGQYGAFWNNDSKHTLALLKPFGADWTSLAWAVNDAGVAAGESHPGVGDVMNRPVVWNNDATHTAVNLPMLPGDNYGVATAINNAGQVVGWSTSATFGPGGYVYGPTHYVVWRDGRAADLMSMLDPMSGAGWTITQVAGINNRGDIVGLGTHDGRSAAFILTPAGQ